MSDVPGSEQAHGANAPTAPPKPQVRHDWYQTETHVVINIMCKGIKDDDVRIMFGQQTLSVMLNLPDKSEYTLGFSLAGQIVPSESHHKVMSTKIEIKLKKADGNRWDALESEQKLPAKAEGSKVVQSKDWDKLVCELTKNEEKPEGEAALNELFQKIYGDGSDEVKKAMNKSFVESGGTVLSTAWNEVSKKPVEVKPPDGLEWRKW